jgi:hypothetical protein
MESSEPNEIENEENELSKLEELDRTGDKAPLLTKDGAQVSSSAFEPLPSDIHGLKEQGKEETKYSSIRGEPSHNDRPALYASIIISIFTVGLALFSLISLYEIGVLGTYVFPASPISFVLLLIVSVVLSVLFIYNAIARAREIGAHKYLQERTQG